ncbi:cation:dicarboxylate symporter family transporter [Reichenbachiella ulvae]|uniref:Cation:dicarboxylase symporter family transporter n=1 Tax=Reichenbachiella ulvae TaxID=2980104 RepID=A0ABT3CW98_9BACT|nr:cation:dicarboxylase symporter family transporter [Reichenbachiella ulvae]MCV9387789.1 cation:dicarboxylase symporter family transporter [Reichenbachiella ulvae]
MKLSTKIIIGLTLGIFAGVFLGEYAAPLEYVGDAFIGLMQMTVLPYILISLLSNLGKVKLIEQKKLIMAAAVTLVFFLVIGLITISLLPFFFPAWESSSFFSTSLVTPQESIDFVKLYIPSNLFGALTNNVVPAVVLFAIIVGVGLNSTKNNKKLIETLETFADALNKANKYIVKLTPIGIFGIAAHTTGTLSLNELGLIQVYIGIYTLAVIVLGLILIPLIVSAVTPFSYKDFLTTPRSSLITIFATGKIIILLPQLIENIQQLFKKYGHEDEEISSSADLIMPLAYPFPNLGTLVIMIFVPFAAWFAGTELSLSDQANFISSVLLSSFVAPIVGIPFLMDILRLPSDIFQLFIVSTAFTDRVRVVLGAIHLFGLAVIAIAYSLDLVKIVWWKLGRAFGITIIFALLFLLPMKLLIGNSFQESFDKYEAFIQMDLEAKRVPQVHQKSDSTYIPQSISVIKEIGYLRVGYVSDALPYVFVNSEQKKVGYDVELMNIFAHEMGIKLKWIQIGRDSIETALNTGMIDIFASGVPVLADKMDLVEYSTPYSELNLALLVADHKRDEYSTLKDLRNRPDAIYATNQSEYMITRIREEIEGIQFQHIASPRPFLKNQTNVDAMFFSAEAGSAWTLVYPGYTVVKPEGLDIKLPVSWIFAKNNLELERFINKWLGLKIYDGTTNRLYERWILGEASKQKEKNWSIIRNVFHWVE